MNLPPPGPHRPATPNLVLRAWREARGMTRTQMADALNNTPAGRHHCLRCTDTLIARWETGRIRCPSTPYQHALHNLTGHDPAALGFTTPTGQPTPGSLPLQQLTALLTSRGLTVQQNWITGEPSEITVTTPHHHDTSRVTLGSDGLLAWQRHIPLDTTTGLHTTAHLITTLLDQNTTSHPATTPHQDTR